jgi:spermidine/putrescine transport system substrate-binding protein
VARTDPAVAKNQLVFPDQALLTRTYQWKALTAEEEQRYNAAFNRVSGGG